MATFSQNNDEFFSSTASNVQLGSDIPAGVYSLKAWPDYGSGEGIFSPGDAVTMRLFENRFDGDTNPRWGEAITFDETHASTSLEIGPTVLPWGGKILADITVADGVAFTWVLTLVDSIS